MKDSLKPGLKHRFVYRVPENRTVPYLYPESADFQSMPKVLATGYMVGLFEWACIDLIRDHLDPGEGSLGTHVDFNHVAATPPGLTVTVEAECVGVDGRRLEFQVRGHDGIDMIGEGRHQRAVVTWDKFNVRLADKARRAAETAA